MDTVNQPLPQVVAHRLQFRTRDGEGQITLYADRTVQVTVPPALRRELDALTDNAQLSSVKWGASLIVGLATLGALFRLRRRHTLSGMLFALSGASGVLARRAKREAERWPRQAFAPVPAGQVTLTPDSSGKLVVHLRLAPPAPPYTLTLAPGEFDPNEARRFANALQAR